MIFVKAESFLEIDFPLLNFPFPKIETEKTFTADFFERFQMLPFFLLAMFDPLPIKAFLLGPLLLEFLPCGLQLQLFLCLLLPPGILPGLKIVLQALFVFSELAPLAFHFRSEIPPVLFNFIPGSCLFGFDGLAELILFTLQSEFCLGLFTADFILFLVKLVEKTLLFLMPAFLFRLELLGFFLKFPFEASLFFLLVFLEQFPSPLQRFKPAGKIRFLLFENQNALPQRFFAFRDLFRAFLQFVPGADKLVVRLLSGPFSLQLLFKERLSLFVQLLFAPIEFRKL